MRKLVRLGARAGACRATTSTICGMTSPARCTTTVSPTRTSLRAISSSLCSVALETTTPPTVTGCSLRDRRQRAGAADLDLDRLDDRRRAFGRELVRDRPARRARDEAEPLLQARARRPCRRRRRCRSRASRAAPRSRGNGRASRRRLAELGQRIDRQAEAPNAAIAPICVVGERPLTSPQA